MCVTSLYYKVELRLILHSLSHLTLDLKVLAGGGRVKRGGGVSGGGAAICSVYDSSVTEVNAPLGMCVCVCVLCLYHRCCSRRSGADGSGRTCQ